MAETLKADANRMKSWWLSHVRSKNVRLTAYLVLAVLVRAVLFVYFPAMLTQDSNDYMRAGLAIHANLDFNSIWLGDVRMPGYPVFLAAIYPLTGARSDLLVLTQTAMGLMCIPISWKLGRLLDSQPVADALALFFAFNPVYILLEHALMTELLAILVMLVFTLLIVICLHRPPLPLLGLAAAALLGAGILVRLNLAVFGAVLLAIVVMRWLWEAWRTPARNRSLNVTALVLLPALGLTLILGPWLWRNYAAYQKLTLSAHGARTQVMWKTMSGSMDSSLPLFQRYSYGLPWLGYEWLNEINARYSTVQAEAIASSIVVEQIRVHPDRQLKAMAATALNFAGIFREGYVPDDDRAAIAWWFRNWVPNPAAIEPGLAHAHISEWLDYRAYTQASIWTRVWGLLGNFYLAAVRPMLVAATLIASTGFLWRAWKGKICLPAYPQRAVASLILAYFATLFFHAVTLTGSDRFAVITDWVALLIIVFVASYQHDALSLQPEPTVSILG